MAGHDERRQLMIQRAPRLGQHNSEVYGNLLGLTSDELSTLAEREII
jgi:crotonobetainyl-CoA:carnitine CoA-transferase CaiB-like acyl-CoA transferase